MSIPLSTGTDPSAITPEPSPQARPGRLRLYAALVGLGLIVRLAILLAARVDLFGPATDGPNINVGEEIFRGDVALEMRKGLLMPWLDHQYTSFFGGSLMITPLILVWMLLIGPRLLAIKLAPVCFHLVATILLARLLDRCVSRRAAWIGGVLFAISPPGYSLATTIAWGSHIESNALAMGYLSLLMLLWNAGRPRPGLRFAAGLLAGFSVYFGYQTALFLVAIGLVDILRRQRPRPLEWLTQAAGFLAGFSPWFFASMGGSSGATQIYGKSLTEHFNPALIPARAGTLALESFPGAWCLPPEWGQTGVLVSQLCFGAMVAFMLFGFARLRSSEAPTRWLLGSAAAYLSILGAALVLSDFEITGEAADPATFRYLMLSAPWVCLAAGAGIDGALRSAAAPRALTAIACAGILGLNLVGTWSRCIDPSRLFADIHRHAVPLPAVPGFVGIRYQAEPNRVLAYCRAVIEQRSPEEADRCMRRLGAVVFTLSRKNEPQHPDDLERVTTESEHMRYLQRLLRNSLPAPYRDYFHPRRRPKHPAPLEALG